MAEPIPNPHHSLLDDAQGLGLGVFLAGLGVHILTHLGFITGQTAGVAVLIAHLSGYSFGVVFFVINVPFYLLAYRRLGLAFTIKSMICVTALSGLSEILPQSFQLGTIHPALGAVAFGALTGLGLLAIFRHNGSLGGLGVVALLAQDRLGVRAGYVQLGTDVVIFTLALVVFPASIVMWSLLGAVVLNLVIAVNHRRDRYIAI